MILAFTGHRPPKAGLTYSHMAEGDQFAVRCVRQYLGANDVELCIVGGALGFDTLAARAAFQQGIPYHVYVPFKGQESKWPLPSQARYNKMLELADKIITVSAGGYSAAAMNLRNIAMVDACDHLLGWWDGSQGGTSNCVRYANIAGKEFTNLYTKPEEKHSVFVFGSNPEGRHGAGAALYAQQHHGAIYGHGQGRQGNSYAIVTKELRPNYPPVTLDEVRVQVETFLEYAHEHADETFELTKIGCGLAGFREADIAPMFANAPQNVIKPEGW